MKSRDEVVLEMKIANSLIEMIYEDHDKNLYNELTTSDLQGYCQVKAEDIIKMIREAA